MQSFHTCNYLCSAVEGKEQKLAIQRPLLTSWLNHNWVTVNKAFHFPGLSLEYRDKTTWDLESQTSWLWHLQWKTSKYNPLIFLDKLDKKKISHLIFRVKKRNELTSNWLSCYHIIFSITPPFSLVYYTCIQRLELGPREDKKDGLGDSCFYSV